MTQEQRKPTGSFASEFVCKLKFRNEIPKYTVDAKSIKIPIDLSKYAKFRLLSDEKELVTNNRTYSTVDIFQSCPSEIIYHSVNEVIDTKKKPGMLNATEEQLCADGMLDNSQFAYSKTSHLNNGISDEKKRNSLGIPTNLPGSKDFTIANENDLVNAIAETFEPCDEFIHPNNPSLKAETVYDLIPDSEHSSFIQCNFDSALGAGMDRIGDLILKGTSKQNEKYFDCYAKIGDARTDSDEYKFTREYNYHGYAEEGNTVLLSLVPAENVAYYSFVNTKINLRKKRGALVDSRDKSGDVLIVERQK